MTDIRIKQPMSAESRVSALEDALTNAKIDLRMSQARECKTRGVIDALLQDGEISESARRDLIATLAGDAQCKHAAELAEARNVIHEWEESDAAKVVLGPILSEETEKVARLTAELAAEKTERDNYLAVLSQVDEQLPGPGGDPANGVKRMREERDGLLSPKMFPIQRAVPIPWAEAERAYVVYAKHFGTSQSLQKLAERGGFGVQEFLCLWQGHNPIDCHEKHDWVNFDQVAHDASVKAEARAEGLREAAEMLDCTINSSAEPVVYAGLISGNAVSDAKLIGLWRQIKERAAQDGGEANG